MKYRGIGDFSNAGQLITPIYADAAAFPAAASAKASLAFADDTDRMYYSTGAAWTLFGFGDVLNGGNSFSAAMSIGTNDNNTLSFRTNSTERISVSSGATTGGAVTFTDVTSVSNAAEDVLTIIANSINAVSTNFGPSILFKGETTTNDGRDMVRIHSSWGNAADANRTSHLIFSTVDAAGAITERLRFTATELRTAVNFVVGSSVNTLTLLSSNTSGGAIQIRATSNTSAANVQMGNVGLTYTTGRKNEFEWNSSYTVSTGSGEFCAIYVHNQINQTGTSSGSVYGIVVSPTLTGLLGIYYQCKLEANNANARGIYQSGALTTNFLQGNTAFGSLTAPTDVVTITGNRRVITGQSWTDRFALTDGATIAISWNNSNVQSVTLAGDRTLTFSNPKDGSRYILIITQDATGSRLVTWPTIKWAGGSAPTLTTTANKSDIITLYYDGTSYYGTAVLNF